MIDRSDDQGVVPILTCRELEVLRLVAQGFSAKEIGVRLNIATRTVERHTENVRLKLRARNRAHLITVAIIEGYLHIAPTPRDSPMAAAIDAIADPARE